jgi:hypothetical protein
MGGDDWFRIWGLVLLDSSGFSFSAEGVSVVGGSSGAKAGGSSASGVGSGVGSAGGGSDCAGSAGQGSISEGTGVGFSISFPF